MPDTTLDYEISVSGAEQAANDLAQVGDSIDGMRQGASQAERAFSRLSNFTSSSHIDRIRDSFRDTGIVLNESSAQLDRFAGRMQTVARNRAFRQLADDANLSSVQIARLRASVGDYSGAMSSLYQGAMQAKLAIAAVGVAAVAFGKSCLDAQIEMQKLETAYGAVFGANAKSQLQAVYEQADRVGLKFMDAAEAAKGFFAAGKGTALEGELQKIFKAVTDSGAALQLSTDEVNGALVALGQMMSKGKVQAEELRGQLGERLPGAFQMAAQAMGMTTAELDKFMADGKLTAEDLLPKLANALERQYGEAAQNAANTVQGSINRMENEWTRFKARIMDSGPVVFAVNFVTRYLKEGNDAAAREADDNRIKKILKAMEVVPEGAVANTNTALSYLGINGTPDYSQQQIEAYRQHEREAEQLRKEIEESLQKEEQASARFHQLTGDALKNTAETKQKELRDQIDAIYKARDEALAAAKSDPLNSQSVFDDINTRADKAIKELQGKMDKLGKSGASAAQSAAKKAAVSQADYTGELERTQSHIESLQQQLKLDNTETVTAAKIKAEQKYQDTISKTNEAIAKQLAQGSISSANAEELKKQKELEASLQKQLDIKQAEEKQTQKNVQAAQGQLKFYKDLAKLSGSYSNDLELQKVLIADQAKKYRDVYGIASELVDEWERLQLLQESNDPFDGAYRGILKYQAEMADTGSQWESLSYDMAKNFTSATRSCFDEFIDTGKASLDSFKNMFKTFLKDLIWQAAAQPIMLSIVGGVGGILGTSSAYGATGSIGGIGSAAAGGGGSTSLLETGMQIGQQGIMNQLMGSGSGSLLSGITTTINDTVAGWMPSLFASSHQASLNATLQAMHEAGIAGTPAISGASTTFTSALGTAGIGAGIGAIASPFVNSMLGLQNNSGSSIGSMVGGGLGTLGGALIAASAIPGAGWIAGGVAALGSLLGGGIGSIFGSTPKQEPKLEVDLNAALWRPMGEQQWGMADGATKVSSDTGGYWVQTETTHGASGQWDLARGFAELGEQVHAQSWAIADALGEVDATMKSQYLAGLEAQGTQNIHIIHRGDWINDENIQDLADWYVNQSTGAILKALGSVDLTPVTIAADGMAADTAEEIATAFSKIFSFVNTSVAIEDEDLRASFTERATEQMREALDNISLEPLARTAEGMAVTTVDEFSQALADVFSVYDLSANLADEGARAEFQSWAQTAIERAFASTDLSFLRVDFDKTSFGGLQQAYAAIQAWEEVEKGIEAVINPMSEFDTQMDAARLQFDSWLDTLRALGWQEEALAEVEARRVEYLGKIQDNLEREMRQNLSLRYTALTSGSDSNVYALQSLLYQQQNERLQWQSQFGSSHPLYQQGVAIQQGEFINTLIGQFEAMRDQLQQQEQEAERSRIQKELEALSKTLQARQKELSAAQKLADTFRRFAQSLEEFRRDLWSGEDNLSESRYAEAYIQFDQLYERAIKGDEDAYNEIQNKASELLQLGREQLPERGEYRDLFYDVDQKLKKAQEYAGSQADKADAQVAALNAQIEALNRQQETLNAQLAAIGANTAATQECEFTLEEINAAIAYLQGQLQNQLGSGSTTTQWDWDRLISEKVADLNAMAYKGDTSWNSDKFLKEVASYNATLEQWYAQQGLREGYTLHAVQNTNSILDDNYRKTYKQNDQNTYAITSSLGSNYNATLAGNSTVSTLLGVNQGYWPQAINSIGGLNSGLNSVYSGVSGLNGGLNSIYRAIVSLATGLEVGVGGSYGGSSGSWSGGSSGTATRQPIYGSMSWYSENDMLQERANLYNQGRYLGRTDWNVSNTRSYILQYFSSIEDWYRKQGYAEIGLATGGLSPVNRPFWVGEEGPELMMSPRQYGVLSNPDSMALMERMAAPAIPATPLAAENAQEIASLRSVLIETMSYMRQAVVKMDKCAYGIDQLKNYIRKWDTDGLPHETEEDAA